MKEIINEHILPHFGAFVSAILTGLAGFLFGKRKLRAETETIEVNNDAVEIANADKLVTVYQNALDDLGKRYEAKFREITSLYEEKIKLMQDEINSLKRTVKLLKEENAILRQRLKEHNLE